MCLLLYSWAASNRMLINKYPLLSQCFCVNISFHKIFMQFVCFSFDFEADSLKLLGLIIKANFMGYLVAVFCLW